jgi:hypothetical protein
MIQQQALSRYYSRDKLHEFLKNKFGNNINFNIQRNGDEYLTFEAPELLTAVSSRSSRNAHRAILTLSG